ncbi:MAG: biotin--[acetyl-CoA-carboxylase] ligase [Paracoccaceae bacterium]|nr:biotin--[acetyl-CoA-carboxylase] ligase [Paracoccaceae bacterium]
MTWPDGYGRRVLAEVDSTNAEAARIAGGLAGPEWILALKQSAARGRRGRVWHQPAGQFSATLVLRPVEPPEVVALRSFVAALALRETCVALTGAGARFALKWPNDVLLNGGKVAGILLESFIGPEGARHLAIGVGVNLIAAPAQNEVEPGAVRPVSLQGETGVEVTPEAFLETLAQSYARLETQFCAFGFAPIRTEWLRHAAKLGEAITARTGNATHQGVFETVDDQGNLVLKTPKGRVQITAADVFFD